MLGIQCEKCALKPKKRDIWQEKLADKNCHYEKNRRFK